MFHAIEKYRTLSQVLLGIIGVSFVGFGIASFEIVRDNRYIVKIGDQVINRAALDEAVRTSQASGGSASREEVFQTLVQRAYLMEGAKALGIAVSDTQIKQGIVDAPIFHDEQGKFSPERFQTFLKNNHLSESAFMQMERERLTLVSLLQMLNSNVVTSSQAERYIQTQMAERVIRTSVFNPENYAAQVKAGDAELQKYYDAHKSNYAVAPGVKYEYMVVSPKDLADKQTVSAEEVQAALKTATTNQKPTRRIAHIMINAPKSADAATRQKAREQAEKIAQEAKASPDKFAELAKQYSQDTGSAQNGGDLGALTQGSLPAKPLDDAAFKLAQGAVSDVVETDFGYHIVRVLEIQGNDAAAQEARVRQELQLKKAQQAYEKIREEIAEFTLNTPDLKAAAQKFGLSVQQQNEWLTQANAGSLHVPKAVADALFSEDVMTKKHISEGISADGATWFVRVTDTRPAGTETLATARDRIRADFVRAESIRLARAAAQQAQTDLQARKAVTLAWTPEQNVLPMQMQAALVPADYKAFMAAVPNNGQPAYAVVERGGMVELVEVLKNNPLGGGQIIQAVRMQLAQLRGETVTQAYLQYLQTKIPTKQGAEKVNEE